ncbi:hypothetical protein AURDEDRAFT_33739, partial [Auricularia subglabra TFB-10046 SS5]
HGGLNLFSVRDRNDAQYLAWVSAFLSPPEERPLWAPVADSILRARMIYAQRGRVPISDRQNPLMQDWRPNVSRLPLVLARLITTARKYKLSLDLPFVPQRTKESVKVWAHHALTDKNILHTNRAALRCLRTRHEVHPVEDLEEIAEADDVDHESAMDCPCDNCAEDRAIGCKAPYECQTFANDLLGAISAKWNPSTPVPNIPRDLWDTFEEQRDGALVAGEIVVFNSRVPDEVPLRSACRVFGHTLALEPDGSGDLPRRDMAEPQYLRKALGDVTAIVCAGMYKYTTAEARGGYAVHFPDTQYLDIYGACPEDSPSFTMMSAFAICETIDKVDSTMNLHIVSTCKFVVDALTISLARHEGAGWTNVPDLARVMRATAAALRSRSAETTFTYVSKRRQKNWQEVKDTKACALTAAMWSEESDLDLAKWQLHDWPGISAVGLDQKKAHTAIRNQNVLLTPPRRVTAKNLDCIQSSVKAACDYMPTTRQIWESLNHKDIPKNVYAFLWKGIHGAHKVGDYFEKMPEPWKSKGRCPSCQITESMEHILFECPDSHHEIIWHLTQTILSRKEVELEINIGLVWGCACIRLPHDGSERLARILIAESAFLIWKLRCEKWVGHAGDPDWRLSASQAGERWKSMLGTRAARDARLQDSRRYGDRSTA